MEHTKISNISELFNKIAAKYHKKIAIVDNEKEYTYTDLNKKSNQLATFLQKHGVKKNTLVAICAPKSGYVIITLLAIVKLGAVYVPISYDTPDTYIKRIIDDAKIKLILTEKYIAGLSNDISCISLGNYIDEISSYLDIFPATINNLNKPFYILYTSGTTGKPKGVIISQKSVLNLISKTNYVKITYKDVFLNLSPIEFDGSVFEIWGAILNGARLIMMPPGFPTLSEISTRIEKNNISILFITTQLFNSMVDHRPKSLVKVKQIFFGGEVASVSHVKKILKFKPVCLSNIYGPTECTTFSTYYRISFLEKGQNFIPIGKGINGIEVCVVNKKLRCVDINEEGELLIGGEGIALGYINDIKLTKKKFIINPFAHIRSRILFKTGDIVKILPDKNLQFIGRKDRLVKIRGNRVSLDMIESEILKFQNINSAAIDYIQNIDNEKIICAWIKPTNINFDMGLLKQYLKNNLPSYMVPNLFYIVDKIQLKRNGKIDYEALRK